MTPDDKSEKTALLVVSIVGALTPLAIWFAGHKLIAANVGGAALMLIGILVVIGYMVGQPSVYTIPRDGIGVALPTAIGFVIAGASIMILSGEIKRGKRR